MSGEHAMCHREVCLFPAQVLGFDILARHLVRPTRRPRQQLLYSYCQVVLLILLTPIAALAPVVSSILVITLPPKPRRL